MEHKILSLLGGMFKKALENKIDTQDFAIALTMKAVSIPCVFAYSRPWRKKHILTVIIVIITPRPILSQIRKKRSCISLSVHVVLDTFNKNINDRK